MAFSVRVEGIRFSAAHFATYGGACEPLHGHTYEVAAEVQGALTGESWVLDFSALKRLLRAECEPLDHRFILQCESRVLQIDRAEGAWKVTAPGGLGYVFPVSDVAALAIDNTTAERLAEYLAGRLAEMVEGQGARNLTSVAVEVWEGPGQRARFVSNRLPLE